MRNVIHVEDLSFHYNSDPKLVLKNVSFDVDQAEVVGIIGPSGAGKSTLCYCLKGLIPHLLGGELSGDVWVNGKNTRQISPGTLAEHIGIVFQDPESQIVGLTVEEELAFGPENLEEAPEVIRKHMPELLDLVGLKGMLRRETYKLSGGQKQRLAIASALMMNPQIIVLDEPTSELDPIGLDEVYASIKDLKNRGTTIILVDHHIEEMLDVVERILVLDEGTLVADASPRSLFGSYVGNRFPWLRQPQIVEVVKTLREEDKVFQDLSLSPIEHEFIDDIRKLFDGGRKP